MIAFPSPPKPRKPEKPAANIVRPQPGPQEQFLASSADIVLYGGAAGGGKTFALLLESLRHVGNPRFGGLILRRTTKEVCNVGGLWDEAEKLYQPLSAEPRIGSLEWRFPSGAKVKFDHLEHEQDKHKYQGSQVAFLGFDELTRFTAGQFWYLLSRNRSTCGVRPYVRATCNPDADSWVADLVRWWVDSQTGYAIPERSGVVRYFVRIGGELHWADTPEELQRDHPDSVPKSFTFIAASLEDNPALTSRDPGYLGNLLSLPSVDRERLLRGNWRIRSQDGAEWGDACFSDLWEGYWPGAFELSAMAIDPSKGREHGDFAAIVFAGVSGGLIWVDATIAKLSAQSIAEATVALYREHLPSVVGMEDNANQDLAFGSLVESAAAEVGCPPLPLVHYTQRANKVDRIYRLGPHVNAKRLRFRSGSRGCELLESQLRGFPLKDVHDDGPDALEQAIGLLNQQAARGYAAYDTAEEFAL